MLSGPALADAETLYKRDLTAVGLSDFGKVWMLPLAYDAQALGG